MASLVNRNVPLAVRGTRLAIRRGRDLPLHEAEVMAEAFRERVVRTEDAKEGPQAFLEKRDPGWRCQVTTTSDDPLRASDDHVATITLDRPEVMNAFDRMMCEEMRAAWRAGQGRPAIHAVVLRAAGDPAFCAGLDTKQPYGQPDDVWNHEDPGELLSPKWQQCGSRWSARCNGICTAGALYFVNEADIVICSDDATFFDSHVTYGLVSALEPVGLMRQVGLGRDPAHRALG